MSLPVSEVENDYMNCRFRSLVGCLGALLFISCKGQLDTAMDGKKIFQELSAADTAYRTNDANHARSVLMRHKADLQKWREGQVTGIDYDTSLAIACGRLFVLSEYLGDAKLAETFYQESAMYFERSRKKLRQPVKVYTRESIRELILKWDATGQVLWRSKATKH